MTRAMVCIYNEIITQYYYEAFIINVSARKKGLSIEILVSK